MKRAGAAVQATPVAAVRRKRPDTAGTPGSLISGEGLSLVFGSRLRASPYDGLLDSLAAAAKGQVLRFDDVKAKAAVYARAKKKGMRVSFAENDGKLFVRFDGSAEEDVKATRRTAILAVLKARGPVSAMVVAVNLRNGGDASVDASLAETILEQMVRTGAVIKQEGGLFRLPPAK